MQNSGHSETYVLVTVEPAGVVAQPGVQEREFVLFNIGKQLNISSAQVPVLLYYSVNVS